ncbi:MAG: aminoacyl-tRNA hydrolase [Saprospiraceae bacterium]|nr:aminoacyl-tRNA hydrolase [Saprospiraceae bacterium]
MKYLIIGLGNMHPDYDDTRHNIGFDVVDVMAEEAGAAWKLSQLGAVTQIKHRGRTLVLLKPSTYMNRSGKSVRYWMTKEKVPVDRIMVVVDDIHIEYGTLRMRGKGSDGGHNGLKDIQQHLGGNKYPRLKVGIGGDFYKGQQVDYVLGKWTSEERDKLPGILKKAGDAVKSFAAIGLGHTMSQYNG